MSKSDLPPVDIDNSTQINKSTNLELLRFINTLRCRECNRYIGMDWSSYDGNVYCQRCWDVRIEKEEALRQKQIETLKNKLIELGVKVEIIQ